MYRDTYNVIVFVAIVKRAKHTHSPRSKVAPNNNFVVRFHTNVREFITISITFSIHIKEFYL